MNRRRKSRAGPGHGTPRERAEFRAAERFVDVLRRFQLATAAIMFAGLATCTFVLALEARQPLILTAGVAVFILGLLLFPLCTPLTRWWLK